MSGEDSATGELDTMRKIVHDLNGEIFLIRGHVELARNSCRDLKTKKQLEGIQERTNALDLLSKRLRQLEEENSIQ
ncbi:hypothetical protein [Rubellicoccus peritrichatus]|uniref:Histidine kinase n=1 Tax=Rubellicoccus peritrichatus TaxID=3080537 RepID=A0AAQ3QXJ3_9BACT|nr:hypothetical protein [Puniceicoccus sp. CR14]WOO43112.1 hypothetical protein RZN69_08400 [Puniceicoccus sp. CR14]